MLAGGPGIDGPKMWGIKVRNKVGSAFGSLVWALCTPVNWHSAHDMLGPMRNG
jgi:hypothetical protein